MANNDNKNSITTDVWENIIKKHVPPAVIIEILLLIGINWGINWVFHSICSNPDLTDEMKSSFSQTQLISHVAVSVIGLIVIVATMIWLWRKKKRTAPAVEKVVETALSGNNVNAYIVQSEDEEERDKRFQKINTNVKKSYWVFGTALSSVATKQEQMLMRMARRKVEIRLCMMNPDITAENVCQSKISNGQCDLYSMCQKFMESAVENKESFGQEFKAFDDKRQDLQDSLSIHKILITPQHIMEYFSTVTDYAEQIRQSEKNINAIIGSIQAKDKKAIIKLKKKKAFIPMSITIADAKEESGMLVVEFHIPFSASKVLLEVQKKENGELFKMFVELFEDLWGPDDN